MGLFIDQAFDNTHNNSLLGSKMQILESTAMNILNDNLDGDVAECGVYKGGSARLLSSAFPHKKVFLFDSFSGMMESDSFPNGHQKGDFADTSLDQVKAYLADKPNCLFFQGWIPESTHFLTKEKFCFVHLDLDLYASTKSAIGIFWPRIVEGGVMIFDDWRWHACPGVEKAINEYFNTNIQHTIHISDHMCIIYKK